MSELSKSLSGFKFNTQFDHSFRIVAIVKTNGSLKQNTGKKENQKAIAWIPLAAQYPMVGLTLIVPVVAIIVLEVLYQASEMNHGLLDIYETEKSATYLSRYISSEYRLYRR